MQCIVGLAWVSCMVYLASSFCKRGWFCCNVSCLHNIIQSKNRHARRYIWSGTAPHHQLGGLEACPPEHFSVLPVDTFLTCFMPSLQKTKSELQQNLRLLGVPKCELLTTRLVTKVQRDVLNYLHPSQSWKLQQMILRWPVVCMNVLWALGAEQVTGSAEIFQTLKYNINTPPRYKLKDPPDIISEHSEAW